MEYTLMSDSKSVMKNTELIETDNSPINREINPILTVFEQVQLVWPFESQFSNPALCFHISSGNIKRDYFILSHSDLIQSNKNEIQRIFAFFLEIGFGWDQIDQWR